MKQIIYHLALIIFASTWVYLFTVRLPKEIMRKSIKKENEHLKTDSLNYQIKVRDSIIYDLYQENKRLKLNQNNF